MKKLVVDTGSKRYPIDIGYGVLEGAGERLAHLGVCRAVMVTDSHVGPLYAARVAEAFLPIKVHVVTVPEGEGSKSHDMLLKLYDEMLAFHLTRGDALIALGGGVVGDLGGYAAATYMRGIAFIQVPTTLLAMVDSSVGGKVAVNLPKAKNMIGTFYQPDHVIADLSLLDTLDERQIRAGLAEVIKYGCIADAGFFEAISARAAVNDLRALIDEQLIARCCEIKAGYVERDEHDLGVRMELNFGHTLGHAIESVAGYGKVLHGEGVSIGMCFAARLGEALGVTERGTAARIEALCKNTGLMYECPPLDADALIACMTNDKKALGATVRFVLLEKMGKAVVQGVDLETVRTLIKEGGAG